MPYFIFKARNKSIDKGITFCYLLGMKTAISIPDEIFKEVEKYAKKHDYSRSEVFATAIKEYLEKIKSKLLLDALNEAYSEIESIEDISLKKKAKEHYAKKVLKRPY